MIKSYHEPLTFDKVEVGAGLKAALGMVRSEVIHTIAESGIRGRGGAGFPTGVKWNLCAAATDPEKYVVCNADEGEPGTFKDRVLLAEYADKVFEGMTIAAYAIGAHEGIIYLRAEYMYLLTELEAALAKRRQDNLLGESIMGKKDLTFDIRIQMGSGAYVCGEETALIESLEGFRGEPRNRPPFPVDTGFKGHPTAVNNVETFAWATCVLANGAAWFKGLGTEKSAGLKLFSISGDCDQPGIYEFPMGVTITEVLDATGGEGAKAVQIGGASGHCIPYWEFDRKICFEDVATGGSVIIFDFDRDMLGVAKNFMEFFCEESCGQCTPCRDGNSAILEGLEMLEEGACSQQYLQELCELGETMQLASKCGLGQSSPNAFLSIVKNFKDELLGRGE